MPRLPRLPHTDDANRTRAGDAFERLRPRLTAIGRRIVGSDAEAEDVVQDCFLKWLAADRAALDTPAAWLTTVVRHGAIDRLRARARDGEALAALALDPANDAGYHAADCSGATSPEDALLRRAELAEGLARLLALPSPAERVALVLHDALDCAHADIAALLGILPATARQHVSRARRRLRAHADETVDKTAGDAAEKRCRERVRRFQAAINGMDVPALAALLADEQPMSVLAAPAPSVVRPDAGACACACANDARYATLLAA